MKPLSQFSTNGFVENPFAVIGLSMMAGMGLMFLTISAGLPTVFSFIGLFGGILGVFGFCIATIRYTLFENGIQQDIKRKIPYWLWKKESVRFFEWTDIQSFKRDSDLTRGGKEYQYLKLYLRKAPHQIWITNQIDAHGFEDFSTAFLNLKQEAAEQKQKTSLLSAKPEASSAALQEVKEKKSFYDTYWAFLITLFFVIVSGLLLVFGFLLGMGANNWWKLFFVILPGTSYMVYRVFIKKREK